MMIMTMTLTTTITTTVMKMTALKVMFLDDQDSDATQYNSNTAAN